MTTELKVLIITGGFAITTFATASIVGVTYAATQTATNPPFLDALVSKFNLNKDEVVKFFADQREARQDEQLNQLVTDKKLTQEQRDKLEAKQDEINAKREELRNSSKSDLEKRAELATLNAEMQNWLKDNNIDISGLGLRGEGRGPGRGIMGF